LLDQTTRAVMIGVGVLWMTISGCAYNSGSLLDPGLVSLRNDGHSFEHRRRVEAQHTQGRLLCMMSFGAEPAVRGWLMDQLHDKAKLRPGETFANITFEQEVWYPLAPLWCITTSTVTADVYYLGTE
jgi:hypothetical protein